MTKIPLILGLVSTLSLTGCTTVTHEEIQSLSARLTKIEARLTGFDKELDDLNSYLAKKSEYDKKHIEKHNAFSKEIKEQLESHNERINNMTPNFNK